MKLPNVGKSSFFYSLLFWSVYLYFNVYFRRFSVTGRNNIPAGKPIIFAGNHQNALMDALSILFAARGKVVFLARADLFKKKYIARILFFMRILPVYRIRDGISSMGQNDATFKKAAEILRAGTPIALFPEGNHAGYKRLRSLKKGICRIAFMAEEQAGYNLDLHIVPSGIDYSNYSDPGARLLVKYGKPIRVADFIPQHHENPQKALSLLRDKLSEEMEPLMINISSEEDYDTYMNACKIFVPAILRKLKIRNNHHNRLLQEKEVIFRLGQAEKEYPLAFESLRNGLQIYNKLLYQYGLRDWLLRKKKMPFLSFALDLFISLLLSPIYFYGLIINYIPYKLPLLFSRKVKDPVFHSSIHFGTGLVIFPLFHLILLTIFSLLTKGILLKIAFAISLPLSGIFTFYYYIHFLKLGGKFRLLWMKLFEKYFLEDIQEKRSSLLLQIYTLLKY